MKEFENDKTQLAAMEDNNFRKIQLRYQFWRFVIGVLAGSALTGWTGYLIQQRELDLKELEQSSNLKLKEQENLQNYFQYTLEGDAYERLNLSIFYGTILEDPESRNRWKEYESILTKQLDEVVTMQFRFDSILGNFVVSDHGIDKELRKLEEKRERLKALLSPVQYQSYRDGKNPSLTALINQTNANPNTSEIQNLRLERIHNYAGYTVGKLYNVSDGNNEDIAFTMEGPYRDIKISGQTRIPAGKYRVIFNENETELTKRYRELFAWFNWHLMLENVPNFMNVYFHVGNRASDTEGSILVGKQVSGLGSEEAFLMNSRQGFQEVYLRISASLQEGKEVYLEIIDSE